MLRTAKPMDRTGRSSPHRAALSWRAKPLSRSAFIAQGVLTKSPVIAPPNRPNPKAASVLPIAKLRPRVAAVVASIAGSVTGEDSQNAMIGASGTPAASNPAIKGSTVTPHTGVMAPKSDAANTVRSVLPSNAPAMWASAPLAMIQAARTMPGMTIGATTIRPHMTNLAASAARSGQARPTPAKSIRDTLHTRSLPLDVRWAAV